MKLGTARLRRAKTIVGHWQDATLVLENYRSRIKIHADSEIIALLTFFEDWQTPAGFYTSMVGYDRRSLVEVLSQLTRFGFLVEKGSREAHLDAQIEKAWASWLPAAGFLHFSCRNLAYRADLPNECRHLRRLAERLPPPSPVKQYARVKKVALPAPNTDGDFPRVLLARRTWRQFSSAPVKLSDLATLLWLTWGVQAWWHLPFDRVALKTSPSGGARHPIEAYVCARNVKGLPSGWYHYAADRHSLELLQRGTPARNLGRYLGNQAWYDLAGAVVFMTGVFRRTQWKYGLPDDYSAILLEAGHFCQTFCLVATWLGLAPFCTRALADSAIENELAVDGVSESVLYAAGVGTRQHRAGWSPGYSGGYVTPSNPYSRKLVGTQVACRRLPN